MGKMGRGGGARLQACAVRPVQLLAGSQQHGVEDLVRRLNLADRTDDLAAGHELHLSHRSPRARQTPQRRRIRVSEGVLQRLCMRACALPHTFTSTPGRSGLYRWLILSISSRGILV